MAEFPKVLAISGSTRQASSNLVIVHAIARLAAGVFTVDIYDGLSQLPHFNPDLDRDDPPAAVAEFRRLLRAADGVLICTPEYAMGVPGSLKNAIDWTVSSMEFSGKPVALVTASLSGQKAHQSLLGTLAVIEALVRDDTQVVIPFVKAALDASGQIVAPAALAAVQRLIKGFSEAMVEARLGREE